MKSKIRSALACLFGMTFVICASVFLMPRQVVAQEPSADALYEDYMYVHCLLKRFPHVHRNLGELHASAFDPDTERNFAWDKDKQAWIDTKTLESVSCPNVANKSAIYEDYMYVHCLLKRFPHVQRNLGELHASAFDPDSGRNFAYDKDKQAWIDTKTLECICPKCAPTDTGTTTPPKPKKKKEPCDIEFGYDYMRAPDESAKNLNGFGGSLFCNVKPWIAIGGDFGALFGSTTDTVGTTNIDVSLHRQTYLFGPQFNFYPNDKVKVFVHPLFGGVHDTTKTTIGTVTSDFSANAFAMSFGGGVDVNLNHRFAIRPIQVDYLPTHFGGTWQNNYQISTGVVIRLGEKK